MKFRQIILVLILLISGGFAQIPNNNLYLEFQFDQIMLNDNFADSSYLFNIPSEMAPKKHVGVDFILGIRNNAISPYYNYNDTKHFLFSPYYSIKINKNLLFTGRLNAENKKEDIRNANKPFWSDELAGGRGGVEIGYIQYQQPNFFVKFGRDYFLPGLYFNENLLFSKYNYSYDQLLYGFRHKFFELSAFYLVLNPMAEISIVEVDGVNRQDETVIQRHLNGHRMSINLFSKGYLAINEVMVYAGENRQVNYALFNPLLAYYPYQKNTHYFESNSIISAELFYQYTNYLLFFEFLLDDFQIHDSGEWDQEPTEFGINCTLGKKKLISGFNLFLNFSRVANRTYNAQEGDFENFIYKNYPIGHYLGNNFWEISTKVNFSREDKMLAELKFSYQEYGEEALYVPFNTDFTVDTSGDKYSENFPFGAIHKQGGILAKFFYQFSGQFLLSAKLSYWLENSLLEEDFNFALYGSYHF